MSFKERFNQLQKEIGKDKHLTDRREPTEVCAAIQRMGVEVMEAIEDGNPSSHTIPEITEGEERLAALIVDAMFLAHIMDWNIPIAMAKRRNHLQKRPIGKH